MQIFTGLPHSAHLLPSVLTIGVFDGMHVGHRTLMTDIAHHAHQQGKRAVVVTFDPHPDQLLRPDTFKGLLQSPAQRYIDIASCGIDELYVVPFDDSIRQLTAHEFMRVIKEAANPNELWVGWDFALGRGREGTADRLREIGVQLEFVVTQIPRIHADEKVPSATLIREALRVGDVSTANSMLGYRHRYAGIVVTGDKRGRTIGFPTANIAIEPHILLPQFGVYATILNAHEQRYPSITNIGLRPTFAGSQPRIETHIINHTLDLYDAHVTVELVSFIRPEQKFTGIDALVGQIKTDVVTANSILRDLFN